MNIKTVFYRYPWIILILVLTACIPGVGSGPGGTISMPTEALMTVTAQITQTTATQATTTALPTETLPISTPTPPPLFPLDGYVMLFIKDGDLYFQDGDNLPVKLTHLGETSYDPKFSDDAQLSYLHPMISDDNQKVVFSRSDDNIYSINTNGTQEQIIIPNDWLTTPFDAGTKIGIVQFIPGTHQLLLETHLCNLQHRPPCANSIFIADTDTGEIKRLADFSLNYHSYDSAARNIAISPNGKMLAVGTLDGTQILTMDGRFIHRNILPYKSGTPDDISFLYLSWLPDSSGLIVALPDKIHPDDFYIGGASAYTIWRYTIDDNSTVQIPFDPPVAGSLSVSPDGNWIVYGVVSLAATELYLGNLTGGATKTFGNDLFSNFSCSPDSKHLIHGQAVVLSFDKPPVYGGAAPVWVDSNHFIYRDEPVNNPTIQQARILIAEIKGDEVYYYELGLPPGLVTIRPKQ